jgi:uncharacterized membrane protein YdjX (TVP38/TMEM64 family)
MFVNRWVKGIPAAVLAGVAIGFLLTWSPTFHGVDGLRQTLLSYGPWAAVVSALLMIIQATIAPLPANVTIVANGLVFGPFWGGLLSWVSIVIGASICFALAKKLGKPVAVRFAGRSLESAEKFFERYGLPAMFFIRITPFIPFDAVSYVAGLAGVSYGKFLLATAVGVIPSIVVYSYLGSIVVGRLWWIALLVLIISIFGVWIAVRLFRKLSQSELLSPSTEALPRPASLGKRSDPIW